MGITEKSAEIPPGDAFTVVHDTQQPEQETRRRGYFESVSIPSVPGDERSMKPD